MSQSADHTYIQYFIPHDGDSETSPNLFLVRKAASQLTVGDLQSAFPIPGQYFFRFKQTYGKGFVWLDQNNPSAKAPLYSGKVVIKVSRLSFEAGVAASPTASSAAASSPQAAHQQGGRAAPSAKRSTAKPVQTAADDGDILNLGSSSPAPAVTPQSSTDGNMDEFWGL